MTYTSNKLAEISLVSANFGNGLAYKDVLLDWFKFLGGKPKEVVVVDGGSDQKTQQVYWDLYQDGLIDKLQLIQPNHPDNSKDTCYIQEYTVGAISSNPYVLFFKIDTLPYREGHDDWLDEAITYLDREDVFAIGGSFNKPSKHHDAFDGWYFSHKCSLNFCLMKRSRFMAAMHEFANEYILAGFKGENPGEATNQARWLVEVALEKYIQNHNVYTLCKVEDKTWTVFHTNVQGEHLRKTRERYLNREDVERFMNAGLDEGAAIPGQGKYYGNFYGKPRISLTKRIRIFLGKTPLGNYWRRFKKTFVNS